MPESGAREWGGWVVERQTSTIHCFTCDDEGGSGRVRVEVRVRGGREGGGVGRVLRVLVSLDGSLSFLRGVSLLSWAGIGRGLGVVHS